jgi:hypothetical protein
LSSHVLYIHRDHRTLNVARLTIISRMATM